MEIMYTLNGVSRVRIPLSPPYSVLVDFQMWRNSGVSFWKKGFFVNISMVKTAITIFLLSCFLNQTIISYPSSEGENERLRKKVEDLEREKFARDLGDIGRVIGAYVENLKKRQEKPDNEKEFNERVQVSQECLDIKRKLAEKSGNWSDYQKGVKEHQDLIEAGWKKSWCDKNPGTRDLYFMSGTVVVVGIIVYILVSPN